MLFDEVSFNHAYGTSWHSSVTFWLHIAISVSDDLVVSMKMEVIRYEQVMKIIRFFDGTIAERGLGGGNGIAIICEIGDAGGEGRHKW